MELNIQSAIDRHLMSTQMLRKEDRKQNPP